MFFRVVVITCLLFLLTTDSIQWNIIDKMKVSDSKQDVKIENMMEQETERIEVKVKKLLSVPEKTNEYDELLK